MNWFYAVQGQQLGPVDQAQFEELVRTGVIREDTLVWQEGMDSWKPYASVRGVQNVNLPTAGGAVRYGGFWIRFAADLIDGVILSVVACIIIVPVFFLMGGVGMLAGLDAADGGDAAAAAAIPAFFGMIALMVLLLVGVTLFYNVYFLTKKQATWGKSLLGLKVIRADGKPGISTGLAVGRFFAELLTQQFTFYIGYIIAAFDKEKRSLHDHICGTRVIYTK